MAGCQRQAFITAEYVFDAKRVRGAPSLCLQRGPDASFNAYRICTFRDTEERSPRPLNKSQKNWRLGGKKLEGKEFAVIDSLDFALIRSAELNDGSLPVSMTFIARAARAKMHARISSMVTPRLKHNMAVYGEGDNEFLMLASLCPLAPPAANGNEWA